MATCKQCGRDYDPDEVRERVGFVCGVYLPRFYDGLCYYCCIDDYEEVHDVNPEDKFEDMDDDELDEWGEIVREAKELI